MHFAMCRVIAIQWDPRGGDASTLKSIATFFGNAPEYTPPHVDAATHVWKHRFWNGDWWAKGNNILAWACAWFWGVWFPCWSLFCDLGRPIHTLILCWLHEPFKFSKERVYMLFRPNPRLQLFTKVMCFQSKLETYSLKHIHIKLVQSSSILATCQGHSSLMLDHELRLEINIFERVLPPLQ